MRIFLLNDKAEYNINYRSGLMNELNSRGLKFKSIGLLDSVFSFSYYMISLMLFDRFFISSNIKSNIVFMLFFWRKGVVIINGMGRKRKSHLFRLFIRLLLKINVRKKIVFQNYADYRYFSFLAKSKYYWVPGSGGNARSLGQSENIVVVSRDSKLPLIASSISSAFNLIDEESKVVLVGCSKCKVQDYFQGEQVIGTGFLPQNDIFSAGYRFFQPSGYGEGIPHTLVDALCSSMQVYIYKSDYIKFGLHRLDFKYSVVDGLLLELNYNVQQASSLSEKVISLKYLELVDDFEI
ncbi:hypothetical protein BCV02_01490 [Vibrio breoganii]|uniref:Glycosyltransferase n=1 Tax=Vibrio breoganii TaxID=553239 RepID=A0AAP8MTP5_9VIBR|nr:hypothetical protein [Vibrio breoganii]NMO74130.1 hypothetical protein [Vibrio breoganii]NMR70875.1 hypothetical protein [Vibrio breoganii]PMG02928.1 hypothetical protein BCV02_01490 [Vibrio breoganii]PML88192.1 hypothetical protein BCT67_10795 [Vibrio breoganii]PMP05663.1 hypothetical protein BCS93_18515 [Vibrio breoganii]